MEIKKIELRLASPKDLKRSRNYLKVGQPYVIIEENDIASGVFVLQGDEDPYVLKTFLDRKQIYIPIVNYQLKEYLKEDQDV